LAGLVPEDIVSSLQKSKKYLETVIQGRSAANILGYESGGVSGVSHRIIRSCLNNAALFLILKTAYKTKSLLKEC
jgi:hypothetical protein